MGRAGARRRNEMVLAVAAVLGTGDGCAIGAKWAETESGTLRIVANRGGPTLAYSSTSGVGLLFDHGAV